MKRRSPQGEAEITIPIVIRRVGQRTAEICSPSVCDRLITRAMHPEAMTGKESARRLLNEIPTNRRDIVLRLEELWREAYRSMFYFPSKKVVRLRRPRAPVAGYRSFHNTAAYDNRAVICINSTRSQQLVCGITNCLKGFDVTQGLRQGHLAMHAYARGRAMCCRRHRFSIEWPVWSTFLCKKFNNIPALSDHHALTSTYLLWAMETVMSIRQTTEEGGEIKNILAEPPITNNDSRAYERKRYSCRNRTPRAPDHVIAAAVTPEFQNSPQLVVSSFKTSAWCYKQKQ